MGKSERKTRRRRRRREAKRRQKGFNTGVSFQSAHFVDEIEQAIKVIQQIPQDIKNEVTHLFEVEASPKPERHDQAVETKPKETSQSEIETDAQAGGQTMNSEGNGENKDQPEVQEKPPETGNENLAQDAGGQGGSSNGGSGGPPNGSPIVVKIVDMEQLTQPLDKLLKVVQDSKTQIESTNGEKEILNGMKKNPVFLALWVNVVLAIATCWLGVETCKMADATYELVKLTREPRFPDIGLEAIMSTTFPNIKSQGDTSPFILSAADWYQSRQDSKFSVRFKNIGRERLRADLKIKYIVCFYNHYPTGPAATPSLQDTLSETLPLNLVPQQPQTRNITEQIVGLINSLEKNQTFKKPQGVFTANSFLKIAIGDTLKVIDKRNGDYDILPTIGYRRK